MVTTNERTNERMRVGADFHDHHHMLFLGNYASSFRIWDWAFGTDKRYNQWKLRKRAEKKERLLRDETTASSTAASATAAAALSHAKEE